MKHKVISIGRSNENKIVLNHDTVSRKHAQLIIHNQNDFELTNLNSTNGTFVNDKRISNSIKVQRNDKLDFDWSLVDPFIGKPNVIINPKPRFKKSKNILPILLSVSIALFFFWFLTNEVPKTQKDEVQTETQGTQDTVDDSIQKQPTEGVPNQEKTTANKSEATPDTVLKQPKYTPKSDQLEYSISCLRSTSTSNEIIGFGADLEDGWITFSSDEVGISEEIKVGKELKKDVEKEFTFSNSSLYKKRVGDIFNQLMAVLKSPRMEYQWYIIESSEINAFTAGGLLFITTGIIDFTKNDDELACIIGHEIYHNELGHINKLIRKEKAAQNWFGDYADWTLIASSIAGASFNQENEAYCDMYGVDLAIKAGFDGQAASQFWSRMESGSNQVGKIFRTHPFSEERMDCIDEHIEGNYVIEKR